jgi:yecA family protein
MPPTPDSPPYEHLERQLARVGLEFGAAEAHGLLCGLLCSGQKDAQQRWLDQLLEETADGDLLVNECRRALDELYRHTKSELHDPGLGLRPLLPEDNQPLHQRAIALSEWCQGFLYGLGLSGLDQKRLSTATRDALQDLSQITRMDIKALDESEQDEEDLVEISEFVWVAAMLLFQDLGGNSP